MHPNPSRITANLVVAFSALVCAIGAVGWVCLDRMVRMNADIQEIVDRRWNKVQLAREALRYSALNSRVTMQVFLTDDPKKIGPLLTLRVRNTDEISKLVTKIEPEVETGDERKLLSAVKTTRLRYVDSYKEALSVLLDEGKRETARSMMSDTVLPYLIAYHQSWDAFVDYQGTQMATAGEAAEGYARSAKREALDLLVVGLTIAVSVSVFVTRNVSRETRRREKVERELIASSHQAGIAEVATGVLHNVKNVLSSVGIASESVAECLKRSRAANLSKIAALMREHKSDLGAFITADPKGKQIPVYLERLGQVLIEDQMEALKQLAEVQTNIEHIREIVTAQQRAAKSAGGAQPTKLADLIDDAIRMTAGGHADQAIKIVKKLDEVPPIPTEKHLVLQILVNLIRNAKQACHESTSTPKSITLRLSWTGSYAEISVTDTGIGIPADSLGRLFAHGFTTKKDGHGFGLHSAQLAAHELGGSLCATSEGSERGATFTLRIPVSHFGNPRSAQLPLARNAADGVSSRQS
jgi:signal transduction histidine kinase